jgi:colanic acid/amylovoran biosynthesis protein
MLVEVKGVHVENQGAHLMLLAVLERLRAMHPDARIALTPGPNCPADRVAALGALRKLRLRKRWLDFSRLSYVWPDAVTQRLASRGLAAEGQVNAVLDASGFAYGGSWTPWLMTYAAAEIRRLAARDRPYVFLPQAFGPLPGGHAASDFGAALERAALVCVRDRGSERFLTELNPRLQGRLALYPDFTIGVAGDTTAAGRWNVDERTVLLIPNSQMIGTRNRDDGWRTGYTTFLGDVAKQVQRQGRSAVLLNHEGRDDAALCARIAAEAGGLRVITESDPRAVKGIIGSAAAVVCSRYHGCVAALSQGVPCLGTSWSHKYQALFDDFGAGDWLLAECRAQPAADLLARLLDERDSHSRRLLGHSARLSVVVEEMWNRVRGVLDAAAAGEARR